MKKILLNVLHFVKKYVINHLSLWIITGFVVSHLFLIKHNYIEVCRNDERIRSLEHSIAREKAAIAAYKKALGEIENSPEAVERIARERYNMQRAHEDVYEVSTDTTARERR